MPRPAVRRLSDAKNQRATRARYEPTLLRGEAMNKLLAAVFAALFATATVSSVAFAADEKKDQKKEQSKDSKKKAAEKDKK